MVALNERHGATPAPVGAIFLIGFGHGLHDTDQSAMHLGGGQFWASYWSAPLTVDSLQVGN